MRELPIKDLTVDDDVAANLDLTSVIGRRPSSEPSLTG